MGIKSMFNKKNVVFSFEIFPPKPRYPLESVYLTIEELSVLNPDYISVTYGAGGSVTGNRTGQLSQLIKEEYGITPLAHLTCIGATKKDIDLILADLQEKKIRSILALRGDLGPAGLGEFKTALDLIEHIKAGGDFELAAACYPEGHPESGKIVDKDIRVMKLKEEAGVDFFISQLFFDNSFFYDFLEKADKAGIKAPIEAGIMPVINKKQIKKVVSLNDHFLPEKFLKIMDRYEHDKLALREAGIAFALEQIVDLISSGVRGIHLYTMNNPYIAKTITANIGFLINSTNRQEAYQARGSRN